MLHGDLHTVILSAIYAIVYIHSCLFIHAKPVCLFVFENIKQSLVFHQLVPTCFIDYTKAFDSVDHKKTVENSSRDGNTRTPYLPPEKSICRSRSNRTGHGTTDWFQIRKGYVKAVCCHPAYLTSVQSASCKMLGWMKHKLESICLDKYQ